MKLIYPVFQYCHPSLDSKPHSWTQKLVQVLNSHAASSYNLCCLDASGTLARVEGTSPSLCQALFFISQETEFNQEDFFPPKSHLFSTQVSSR